MHFYKWSVTLTVAGLSGGLFFTLLSGLYWVRDSQMVSVEIIHYGFPFAWLKAVRSTWFPRPPTSPLHCFFLGQGFITDFIIYGLLTVVAVYLCFIAIAAGRKQIKATCSASSKLKYG